MNKECRRIKTKLEFIQAICLVTFYVGLAIYKIMK